MKRFLLVAVLAALALWGQSALYAVDYAEFAYVTEFGRPVRTVDGATDAGLHVKLPWPVQSVQRIDRRLQAFDLPAVEALTRDQAARTVDKTLAVDAFVTWRVPDAAAAERFLVRVGTPEQAKKILAPWFGGRLANAVSTLSLDEIVSVVPEAAGDERSDKLRQQLLAGDAKDALRADYGIEVVDLRVRRVGFPEAVRASIAEQIRSERMVRVARHESDGRKQAAEILSRADKEAKTVEAKARAKKQEVEGQADVDADRIRNDAHAQDREFYTFLQKLKAYQSMLGDTRDVLLLSTKHPLFDLLLSPPKEAK